MSPFSFLRRHPRGDLAQHAGGNLPEARRSELESHVASCGACRAELEDLRRVVATLQTLPPAAVPRSFTLTPEQAAAPSPAASLARSPALGYGMRMASAGLAVALAVVVVADLGGNSGNGGGGGDDDAGTLTALDLTAAAGRNQYSVADGADGAAEQDIRSALGDDDSASALETGVPAPADATAAPTAASGGTAGGPISGGSAGIGVPPDVTPAPDPGIAVTDAPTPDVFAESPAPTDTLAAVAAPEAGETDDEAAQDAGTDANVTGDEELAAADGSEALVAPSDDDSDTLLIVEIALAAALALAIAATIYISRRARRPY